MSEKNKANPNVLIGDEFSEYENNGCASDDPLILGLYKTLKNEAHSQAKLAIESQDIQCSIPSPEKIKNIGAEFQRQYEGLYEYLGQYIRHDILKEEDGDGCNLFINLMYSELKLAKLIQEYFLKLLIKNYREIRLENQSEIEKIISSKNWWDKSQSTAHAFSKHLQYQANTKMMAKEKKLVIDRNIPNLLLLALSLHQFSQAELALGENKISQSLSLIYEATQAQAVERQICLAGILQSEHQYEKGKGARAKQQNALQNKYHELIEADWLKLTSQQRRKGYKSKFIESMLIKHSNPKDPDDPSNIKDPITIRKLISKWEWQEQFKKTPIGEIAFEKRDTPLSI